MGWIDLFEGVSGGALSSITDFGMQALGNAILPLSKAQRQQNEYAAEEARKGRDFTAQQAEINRDWQEEMYAQYNSLSGKVAQARESGINPLYAVTGSATSSMSSTPPATPASVASPGSVSPMGQISDMAGAMLGFSKLSAEIKNINSITRHQNAQAFIQEINALYQGRLNEATLDNMYATYKKTGAEEGYFLAATQEKFANIGKIYAETDNIEERTKLVTEEITKCVAEVRNINADTDLKGKMLEQIGAQIDNLNADTWYKIKLAALVVEQALTEGTKRQLMDQQCAWYIEDIGRLAAVTSNTQADTILKQMQTKLTETQDKLVNRQFKWLPVMNIAKIGTDSVNAAGNLLKGIGSLQ